MPMQNFEEYLMEKYPNLFLKDKNGKTMYSSCGIGGLESWEPIIEEMCVSIDAHCKGSYSLEPTKRIWPRIKFFLYKKIGHKIYQKIYSILDPYRGIIPEEIKAKPHYWIHDNWKLIAEARRRFKWQKSLSRFYFSLTPNDYWEKIYPPQATLAQIKTKFQMARIYLDNADDYCQNVASFTEHLCNKITEGKLKIEKP